jgi:acetylglutamate kinase
LDDFLESAGKQKSGLISSIDTLGRRWNASNPTLTTPEPLDLHRHFYHAAESGIEIFRDGVSSQALKYDRVLGGRFRIACFLNIGQDHISSVEHPDPEDYFQSKLKLFRQSETACVNLDSERADEVLKAAGACSRVFTFSARNPGADVYAHDIRKSGQDILFRVRTPDFSREFRLTMPGLFNVENALSAIAVCLALGIPEHSIYVGLMKARVPGRMEVYSNANNKITVIVDYAHNRLSFERLFHSVREEYPDREIVTVFGCPGGKAQERRRDLGEVAGRYSSRVILTEEDPGEENAEDICREIARYVQAGGCSYSILPDRGKAIEAAVAGCEAESVVLVTGKGAETRQKRGRAYVTCPSDVEYAMRALHRYDVEHHLDGMEKIRSLMDLLPMLRSYEKKIIVIKYGGSTMGRSGAAGTILQDAAALHMAGAKVVLMHGGGKSITAWLGRLGIESKFVGGYRVTDPETMEVTEMTLSGQINKSLAAELTRLGVPAAGISGRDGGLFRAQPLENGETDLGRVGRIVSVNPHLIHTLLNADILPVISPVADDGNGGALNINADDAACAAAEALHADKLVFLTDTNGILVDSRNEKTRIAHMNVARAAELVESGFVGGGMIPKINSCIHALENGVGSVVILDGRKEHGILLESITIPGGIGTTITKE